MSSKQSEARPDGKLVSLAKQCVSDSEEWFGDSAVVYSIPYHTLAMAGEVGEFAKLVHKIERGSLSIQDAKVRYELAMKLTNVFVDMLQLAGLLHIDLEQTYMMVRADNKKRIKREANGNE